MIEIIPAILTDDNAVLKSQLKQAEEFGAQTVQIDFTDGKFVDSKTLSPDELDAFAVSDNTLTLEAHLMVQNPERYFATLYSLGFNRVSAHMEAMEEPNRIIREMREYGMEIGFAINPKTPIEDIKAQMHDIDFVLLLSVTPGAQGRRFERETLNKIREIRKNDKDITIEIDGGIKKDNITDISLAGANRIVIGSGIWKSDNPKDEYESLNQLVAI